jgi:5-methylcytosine-specific restriction endonuclease McrA
MSRRKLTKVRRWKTRAETRRLVWERDGGRCRYCGLPGQEIDHVRRLRGRAFHCPSNVVVACRACNRAKWRHTGFRLEWNVLTWHGFRIEAGGITAPLLWRLVKVAYQRRTDRHKITG